MHDFDYDAMQKKRIANNARRMKNGSKSKRCSLPSDYMTQAEWKRRNGPVATYKFDAPMNWDDFKDMPKDLQAKYIRNLQDLYRVNDQMLADMFHVHFSHIARHRTLLGIAPRRERLTTAEKDKRDAMWKAFLNGVIGGTPEKEEPEPFPVPSVTEPIKVEEPVIEMSPEEPEIPVEMSEKPDALLAMARKKLSGTLIDQMLNVCPKFEPKEKQEFDLSELSAVFTGEFEPTRFLQFLAGLPIPDANVRIKVEVTKV